MLLKSNAVIFGLEGKVVSEAERKFFKEVSPLGFILFARNIETPDQVKSLVSDLKSIVGWECPILIDQEGGRVARLKPPHWRKSPSMEGFARLALKDLKSAENAVYLNYRLIGQELYSLGINVDCAPVCDILFDWAHDIVGDRSFGGDVEIASSLARKCAEGLIDSGVLPIIKHIPGHGRAKADSHEDLPLVDASLDELKRTDFKVFENLSDMPWAMTAHILYTAIDDKKPATLSDKAIKLIRDDIGFDGLLISDDLSMKALKGTFASRTRDSLAAGCDVVLHCNGKMEEMSEIAENVSALSKYAARRVEKSMALLKFPEAIDFAEVEKEVAEMVG
ncbi:MAG: nagZ [Rickettsiaceae bacterium]|nr:nagZ [Rickettsiaceae bacterium]